MNAILIAPNPITKDNIDVAIDAGCITKDQVCAGVAAAGCGLQLIKLHLQMV